MKPPLWRRVLHLLAALVAVAGGLWQLILQLRLYAARFHYPWDIEWLEGAALYQAFRVNQGQITYGPPQIGYLPLFHPPAYPAFLGLLGKIFRLGYPMARTVSLVFLFAACALVIYELVRHHEEERLDGWALGLFAVGVAAAGVPLFEGFYDMIREDVMAVFLCVLLAVVADTRERKMKPRRIAVLAAIITAIIYTRLPAVFFPVWVTIFVFARHRRTGFFLALGAIAGCGLTLVVLQYFSKGWYWMYTVSLLQDHKILRPRFLLGLQIVYKWAPFVVAVPLLALVLGVTRRLSARAALWFGMFVAAIAASLLPFAKVGGFANDFMPACFFLGPAAAFLVADGAKALARHPRVMLVTRALVYAGAGAFLFVRTYDFKRFVPTADQFKKARVLNEKMASLKGGVIVPRHPFFAIQNGSRAQQFADMPYLDLIWSGYKDFALGAYLDKVKARYALITATEIPITANEISARYQLESALPTGPEMVIGERSMLRYLLRWQDDEKDGRVLFDFEKPLEGWTSTGDAFEMTPTPVRPGWQGAIGGAVGQKVANSFHPKGRDPATGTLTSPPFTIDRPHMSLRVGGGTRNATRVELRVEGRPVHKASGIFINSETMIKVVWDVKPYMGKEAVLVLVDADSGSWGHLTCDHVVLY